MKHPSLKQPSRIQTGQRFRYETPDFAYIAKVTSVGGHGFNIDTFVSKYEYVHLQITQLLWENFSGKNRNKGHRIRVALFIMQNALKGKRTRGTKGTWKYVRRTGPQPKICSDCE